MEKLIMLGAGIMTTVMITTIVIATPAPVLAMMAAVGVGLYAIATKE